MIQLGVNLLQEEADNIIEINLLFHMMVEEIKIVYPH